MSDDSPIVSHVANQAYRDNWERTFGKKAKRNAEPLQSRYFEATELGNGRRCVHGRSTCCECRWGDGFPVEQLQAGNL